MKTLTPNTHAHTHTHTHTHTLTVDSSLSHKKFITAMNSTARGLKKVCMCVCVCVMSCLGVYLLWALTRTPTSEVYTLHWYTLHCVYVVCVCVCVCVRGACVRAWVCVCVLQTYSVCSHENVCVIIVDQIHVLSQLKSSLAAIV